MFRDVLSSIDVFGRKPDARSRLTHEREILCGDELANAWTHQGRGVDRRVTAPAAPVCRAQVLRAPGDQVAKLMRHYVPVGARAV